VDIEDSDCRSQLGSQVGKDPRGGKSLILAYPTKRDDLGAN